MKTPTTVVLVLRRTNEATHKHETVALPVYDVEADGVHLGTVERRMVTHERKTPGKRYVNARWQSPGWAYRTDDRHRPLSTSSRRAGVRAVLTDSGVDHATATRLAETTKVVTR